MVHRHHLGTPTAPRRLRFVPIICYGYILLLFGYVRLTHSFFKTKLSSGSSPIARQDAQMVVMHTLGPHPHAPTLEVWFNMLHDRYTTVSCDPKQHKTATTCTSDPARTAPYRRGMPPLLLRLTNQPHPDHTCQKARPTPG